MGCGAFPRGTASLLFCPPAHHQRQHLPWSECDPDAQRPKPSLAEGHQAVAAERRLDAGVEQIFRRRVNLRPLAKAVRAAKGCGDEAIKQPAVQIVVELFAGKAQRPRERPWPGRIIAQPQIALDSRATAYVCKDYVCNTPTTNARVMLDLLAGPP